MSIPIQTKKVLGALAALATLAPSASDAMGFHASAGVSRISPAATSAIMHRLNGAAAPPNYPFDNSTPWQECKPLPKPSTLRFSPAGNVASVFKLFQR